jgi:hypothetical protein
MIDEICREIDKSLSEGDRNNSRLLELVMQVISNEKSYPQKFVQLCYDVHEQDTDTAEDDAVARENNLKAPIAFIEALKKLKEQNIEFWRKT